jgi:predicted metal-dependent hydrolase
MAQKTVYVPEIGELILSKRRGATNMRLSINAAGKVRVGMPYWAPYQSGILFAKSKADWINKHLASHSDQLLKNGDLIGKSHRLQFVTKSGEQTKVRMSANLITISSSLDYSDPSVQKKAMTACEKALRQEAEHWVPMRLKTLAIEHG